MPNGELPAIRQACIIKPFSATGFRCKISAAIKSKVFKKTYCMLSAIGSGQGAKFVHIPMKRLEANTAANASYASRLVFLNLGDRI